MSKEKILKRGKQIFVFISIVFIIFILLKGLNDMTFIPNSQKISLKEYTKQNFQSIIIKEQDGKKILNFMKILQVFAIYMLIELRLIFYSAELTEYFKEIIKYYSKDKKEYLLKTIKISKNKVIGSSIYWIVSILILYIWFNSIISVTKIDILYYLMFVVFNAMVSLFIILISNNSLNTIILYVLKPVVYTIFNGKEIYLILLMLVMLIIPFFIKREIGE